MWPRSIYLEDEGRGRLTGAAGVCANRSFMPISDESLNVRNFARAFSPGPIQ